MSETSRRRGPGRPPEHRGWVQLRVRVPPDLRAAAERQAQASGETLSDVVRRALAAAVDADPPDA